MRRDFWPDSVFRTSAGGTIRSISVTGPVTGRGAEVIILDDCIKADARPSEAARQEVFGWYATTLTQRINDKRAGLVISIQQRICEDDLPNLLLELNFKCLSLPAVAEHDIEVEIGPGRFHLWKRGELLNPVRFPQSVLDQERLNLGPQDYSAQYLENPVALEGNLLKIEQFRRFEIPIDREQFDRVMQSSDPAATELPTSDYSVCTTWGFLAGRYFLLDILRARLDYPTLKRSVLAQRVRWRADHVVIEYSSNGLALVQQLRAEGRFYPVACPTAGQRQLDKAERLLALRQGRSLTSCGGPTRADGEFGPCEKRRTPVTDRTLYTRRCAERQKHLASIGLIGSSTVQL